MSNTRAIIVRVIFGVPVGNPNRAIYFTKLIADSAQMLRHFPE